MKASFLILSLIPLAALSALAEPTPEAVPLARYEPLIARSPFSPASAAVPVTVAPSFARNYYLTGLATVGEKAFVTIASRDTKSVFSLMEGETRDGVTFASVEWVPGVGRSRAVLIRDGQTATVTFDEVAMKAAAPEAAPAPAAAARSPQQGGWNGDHNREGWGGRRGGRGRDRVDWNDPQQRQYMREHRQYMREQRRAWFRAMQQQQR